MTTYATNGGRGGRRKEGHKMIQKEAKTDGSGGDRIICNAINRV